jgi:hypothetical protein
MKQRKSDDQNSVAGDKINVEKDNKHLPSDLDISVESGNESLNEEPKMADSPVCATTRLTNTLPMSSYVQPSDVVVTVSGINVPISGSQFEFGECSDNCSVGPSSIVYFGDNPIASGCSKMIDGYKVHFSTTDGDSPSGCDVELYCLTGNNAAVDIPSGYDADIDSPTGYGTEVDCSSPLLDRKLSQACPDYVQHPLILVNPPAPLSGDDIRDT